MPRYYNVNVYETETLVGKKIVKTWSAKITVGRKIAAWVNGEANPGQATIEAFAEAQQRFGGTFPPVSE